MPTDLPNERSIRKAGSMELDPSAEGVAIDETVRLIASNKVEGTAVYDAAGKHLGAVHNFMVDKVSGQVAYAVLAFGGFLGLGENHHPLPWKALTYSVELGGYVVDIDPATLAGAPSHGAGEDGFADPAYGGRLDDYYGRGPKAA
ncbi:PRC-barrel domain-containing protein [Methylobacterium sp. WL6]|uniref:PRC-barrel domain-containing protein n=1 Tax=Methylobacterium sp. WL6 TaxID=2603901 RepID=UPI0011C9806E|nr:PRC-barrel domain-containing protein [Methylobacterium sp. WL6]TXN72786.1 PRC-barrel domain containing protein [Methylobacterium sp. WL6]